MEGNDSPSQRDSVDYIDLLDTSEEREEDKKKKYVETKCSQSYSWIKIGHFSNFVDHCIASPYSVYSGTWL